jgi:peptidyl-prolyl cis-trans isomerase B (cyclophilin B)
MLKRTLVLPALMLLAAAALTACSGDDSPDVASDPASQPESSPTKTVACDYPDAAQAVKPVDKPSSDAPVEGKVDVTIKTSIGDLHAALDTEATPCTVNSFRSLASQGYFDGTTCHRLTMPASGISVLQCGDPSGTGSGGPGYSFKDELTGSETYDAGTLAMANAGADTNGSQFFIVYGDSQLQPDYTVFGTVDAASLKLIADAASKGTTSGEVDGAPKVPVDITSVS